MSSNYRYYGLGVHVSLHAAEWFYATDDEDAIGQISAKHPDSQCEIWQGDRLVATVVPTHRSA